MFVALQLRCCSFSPPPTMLSLCWAAMNMSFFGTHPTFTHVPPTPAPTRFPLASRDAPRSMRQTRAPYPAARLAQDEPPLPPPMTTRSKSYEWERDAMAKAERSSGDRKKPI